MGSVVLSLLGQFWPYIVGAIGLGIAALKLRQSGANAVRDRQARERLEARSEADKIDQAVAGMTDEEVLKEQAKWSRPKR